MEKIVSTEKTNTNSELLILSNRKNLQLEGISEVISTSDNCLVLKLKDTILSILGEGINIKKLDVNNGTLEAEGKFNNIKYGVKSGNFFKRIFKWKYLQFCKH